MAKLKTYFLTGLVIIVPVFLTISILVMLFNFLDGILGAFLNRFFVRALGFYPPGAGFLLSLLFIIGVGIIAKKLLDHKVAVILEKKFSGLPLIRYIYPAAKQVVVFVSRQKGLGFKTVVMVEYPRKGIWCLGFLTNEAFEELNKAAGKELVSVFLPVTPGPLSGNVVFFPREDLLFPHISVNEVMNILISGGVFKGDDQGNAGAVRNAVSRENTTQP